MRRSTEENHHSPAFRLKIFDYDRGSDSFCTCDVFLLKKFASEYRYDVPSRMFPASMLLSGPSNRGFHLFQGAWTDPVTGIAYHRNRWYDPRTANWLSEDPLGAVDSPNLYAFVGWGPHVGTDPLGLTTGAEVIAPGVLGLGAFCEWLLGGAAAAAPPVAVGVGVGGFGLYLETLVEDLISVNSDAYVAAERGQQAEITAQLRARQRVLAMEGHPVENEPLILVPPTVDTSPAIFVPGEVDTGPEIFVPGQVDTSPEIFVPGHVDTGPLINPIPDNPVGPNIMTQSTIGPGTWEWKGRRSTGTSLEHQSLMTGRGIRVREDGVSEIQEYVVNGIAFDDYVDGVLIDHKDKMPGFMFNEDGLLKPGIKGAQDWRSEAVRQVRAANGIPVEWVVDSSQVKGFNALIQDIPGIEVRD